MRAHSEGGAKNSAFLQRFYMKICQDSVQARSQSAFLFSCGLLFSSKNEGNVRVQAKSAKGLDLHLMIQSKSSRLKLTPDESQQLHQCLIYGGLSSAQAWCKQNGWGVLPAYVQQLERAIAYGSRQQIAGALSELKNEGHAAAGVDKVLAEAVRLLDVRRGVYAQSQAARLLEVAAVFLTSILRTHAAAEWHKRRLAAASGSVVPHDGGQASPLRVRQEASTPQQRTASLRVSREVLNLCHHLETVRKLQELVQKRTASEHARQSQAAEEDDRQRVAHQPLAVVVSNRGAKSGCRIRVDGSAHLVARLAGRMFDWRLPEERALVLKQAQAASEEEGPGALSVATQKIIVAEDERPGAMVARWGRENSPPEVVVRDALRVGRLALAVAYLQEKRGASARGDAVFTHIRQHGRRLAYDFFQAGNVQTALLALRRLGDNPDQALRELAMGSLHRDTRRRAAAELRRQERLSKQDARALQILSDLEKAYPQDGFWTAYVLRLAEASVSPPTSLSLQLTSSAGGSEHGEEISCGDVRGSVLGGWGAFVEKSAESRASESSESAGREGEDWYLCLAADWVSRWDQTTIERIYLERGVAPPTPPSWQAQLQYHVAHHDWPKVEPLLENVPSECLRESVLQVTSTSDASGDDLYVPGVRFLLVDVEPLCTSLMRALVEEKLARQHTFVRTEWQGPARLVALLARAQVLFAPEEGTINPDEGHACPRLEALGTSNETGVYRVHPTAASALTSLVGAHAVVVRHCSERHLPHLMQAYLDWHDLGRDFEQLEELQMAAGECEWAQWLLLSRLPGEEYAASFANARFIASSSEGVAAPATLDDMARDGHVLRALATLVHAPVPLEECLAASAGSESHRGAVPSWHCELQSLGEVLDDLPTLRTELELVCGLESRAALEDTPGFEGVCSSLDPAVVQYVQQRLSLFASATKDASLLSILPTDTAPNVREVLRLAILGPDARTRQCRTEQEWEDAVDDVMMQELTRQEEKGGLSVGHLLRTGRPLAAFEALLAFRDKDQDAPPVTPKRGKRRSRRKSSEDRHIETAADKDGAESDETGLRRPLTDGECVAALKQAVPLAVREFFDVRVTSACCAFLELCGLSVAALQVDLAALQRIAQSGATQDTPGSGRSSLHDLASALSEDYLACIENPGADVRMLQPPQATCQPVVALLAQLEAASLSPQPGRPTSPEKLRRGRSKGPTREGGTAGTWLRDGEGDSQRTAQTEASERWELVTSFCASHGLAPSDAYLRQLAQDDDWLGFLAEAQKEGFPIDRLSALGDESFTNPALKEHVLIVLRSLGEPHANSEQRKAVDKPELFSILAECEKAHLPGRMLLEKARDLQWPLLAVAASSYDGADALSCLSTWLAASAPDISRDVVQTPLAQAVGTAVRKLDKDSLLTTARASIADDADRRACKRRRLHLTEAQETGYDPEQHEARKPGVGSGAASLDEGIVKLVASFCGKGLFLPLLRGLQLFTPASSLARFVRALQAAVRNDCASAKAHLGKFGEALSREDVSTSGLARELTAQIAVVAADEVLGTCPTQYEKTLLLELLTGLEECGPVQAAGARFKRLSLASQLCPPGAPLDDATCTPHRLVDVLAAAGKWDEARDLAQQAERSQTSDVILDGESGPAEAAREGITSLLDHVTILQANALLAEWRELLWDDAAERLVVWGHCSALFEKHKLPGHPAGTFFLKHAEDMRAQEPPAAKIELHTVLVHAVQWLSGHFSGGCAAASREELSALEAQIWIAAIEADRETVAASDSLTGTEDPILDAGRAQRALRVTAELWPSIMPIEAQEEASEINPKDNANRGEGMHSDTELIVDIEKQVAYAAVFALLEVGRLSAARGLLGQLKLRPPDEFYLAQAAETIALKGTAALPPAMLDTLQQRGLNLHQSTRIRDSDTLQQIADLCPAQKGRAHILRLAAVCQAASVLSLEAQEAGKSTPLELMQLLALQAGRARALDAARGLASAYEGREELPPRKVAGVLAECFQKGLVAAHKGGYLQDGPANETGPAPLLWKPDDFVMWAEATCPSAPQIGHALMRLVIGGKHDLAPACEAELLICAHRFYSASACFDGLDVLSALASNRAAAYLPEDHVASIVRLLVGTFDFGRLRTLVDMLVANGHLKLLLTKLAAQTSLLASAPAKSRAQAAILSALAQHRGDQEDQEYVAEVASVHRSLHALHETATSLERRARAGVRQHAMRFDTSPNALSRRAPPQAGSDKDLLDTMELYVQAAETWARLEAGLSAARCAHQASLVSVQLRLPDVRWLDLSEEAARHLLAAVEGGFAEALTFAQAYGLVDPLEWVPLIWNQVIWRPLSHTERFLHEYSRVLPLAQPLLMELARAYRAEVAAREADVSLWLPSGAGGAESGRHLLKAFRALLCHVHDYKLRLQLATLATGFSDVVDDAIRMLDKVPETAGPLILRKGHGATYVPLM